MENKSFPTKSAMARLVKGSSDCHFNNKTENSCSTAPAHFPLLITRTNRRENRSDHFFDVDRLEDISVRQRSIMWYPSHYILLVKWAALLELIILHGSHSFFHLPLSYCLSFIYCCLAAFVNSVGSLFQRPAFTMIKLTINRCNSRYSIIYRSAMHS
jgi:hypothetical protein